ncbi:S8 family serine peptidase [Marivirga salinae]|uniref:S8 family serine peptidase n=1 Tax=Marivirga salinarum TaxID=3059078 RepID=A0AA51NC69_9BACT|nr:S8 family serine peptidase [Marivirga sp. BDSF4-3]WMN10901.1 S8 family serine peptidase [Marivirga sp. BDSF4-3]
MKYILTLLLSIFIFQQSLAQDYVPGLIVVKLKDEDQTNRKKSSNTLSLDLLEKDSKVKNIQYLGKKSGFFQRKQEKSRLDNIYKLDIKKDISEEDYIKYINSFDNIEYAERYPNVKPLYVPNDPEAQFGREQFHLAQINVYDAWNVTQGNEDIIIGVIDTGADLDHEDLVGNLYLNVDDSEDGVDNDNDGYIDNYYGWDFADNDNSPEADGSTHGTGVTGIAAAATDNNTGIAGIGFNTKFMPIKIFQTESNFSRNSYEAIIYAADQGCDVINLSWGSSGRYSQFAQDIINYAALEKDAVIVAAAGNTNAELDFFPASYDNVLSVGFVNADDSRNSNATYSDFIDLVAPGSGIYSTENNDTYATDGGSSYAAPMVAGAAALVRSVFPEWNALQVMEQLRVSTDDINDVANNSNFQYKFGKGRLNVFKALADYETPAIRISNVNYTNGLDEAAYFGDTLDITIEFTNFLEAAENISVSLTSSSPYVNILQGDFEIPALGTSQKITNENNSFKVVLSEDLPEDEALNFRILFEGEFYNDYQSFQIQSSPKIRLFEYNGWEFGFTATGNLGRSYATPFSNYAVTFDGKRLIDHMGLILSVGEDSLRRNTLVNPNSFQYLEEFQSTESLKRYDDITADFDVRSVFKEQDTISNPLNIYIDQRFLGWDDESNILIHQYQLQNRSKANYDSVYFALFTDYALSDKIDNKLNYDSAYQLSYAFNEAENEYVGLGFIGNQDSIFYAFDLAEENGHISDLENDSLRQNVIQNALQNPFSQRQAGELAGGNNVGGLHGLMISEFPAASTQSFSFALLRANSLAELQALIEKAREKDSLSALKPPFGKQILICRDDTPVIEAQDGYSLKVYASPSVDTTLYEGTAFETGTISNDSVFYISEIDTSGISSIRKRWILSITKPNAAFMVPDGPLLLEPEIDNVFRFMDESNKAVSWDWSFSNGFTSTNQNPNITIEEAGDYEVELIVSNTFGCKDTLIQSFQAVMRSPKPQITNQEVCKNESLSLNDPTIDEITVYADSLMNNKLFTGAEFVVEELDQDTVFFLRNETGEYPSTLVEVEVSIIPIAAKMEVSLDLNSSNEELQGVAISNSEYATNLIWMMGNDTLGTENEIYFNLKDLNDRQLKLMAISEYGCIDSTVFETTKSEIPEFDDYYLCQSQSVNLSALNTDAVYYFTDENLSEFIGKGSNVTVSAVSEDMTVYAVNVENIEPSDIVEVPIFVSNLSADFNASHDTINLAFEQNIILEALSESGTEWTWHLNGNEIGNSKNLQHEIGKAGVFTVELLVSDSLGCSAQSQQEVVVFNDPLLGTKNELKSYFSIFPNPADKMIHLTGDGQFKYDSYSIIDTKGKELMKGENDKPIIQTEIIDVSELKEGPYYLIIRKGKQEGSFLFVIRR